MNIDCSLCIAWSSRNYKLPILLSELGFSASGKVIDAIIGLVLNFFN